MDWKKVQKLIEAVNTYYGFAVLVYLAVLYIASHNHIFWWALLTLTPVLAGWTGYLLKGYLEGRNLKYGFQVESHEVTYEILGSNRYRYTLSTQVKAAANRLMTYPVGYQWSGEGIGSIPKLPISGQSLLGIISKYNSDTGTAHITPYKEQVSSESDWNYWFVGLDHALYKGETANIKYIQDFYDARKKAKPYLYHMVNTATKKLELNVKFSAENLPTHVSGSYFKLNDRRRTYLAKGVVYNPDTQVATWTISRPKYGYCYRIDWQ